MTGLTKRQQQIADFIERRHRETGSTPTYREIADHFKFASPGTVVGHIKALRQKGVLPDNPRQARSLRVRSPLHALRKRLVDIPFYGSIPAGLAEDREQEATGCVSVDIESVGIKPNARTFALEVRGDSMIGKHIVSGDTVIVQHDVTPKPGDVVAALIDGESTLKTFMMRGGKPFLRAENPRYPDLVPASELVIQGVVVALIRKRK